MGKRRRYTAEDHHKAFEIYYKHRTYSAVSEEMQLAYTTPFRWAEKAYICPFGCPWHGWDALLMERERAIKAKIHLLEKGDTNPLHHEKAMTEAIQSNIPTKQEAIRQIVRSDLERLTHWEMLYAKVFFDATGVALDYDQIKDTEVTTQAFYRSGLHVTSLESAIRALQACQTEISRIKGQLTPIEKGQTRINKQQTLGIAELRAFKNRLDTMPAEQIKVIAREVIIEGCTVTKATTEEIYENVRSSPTSKS